MEHELSFEEIKVLREAARVKMKNTLVSYVISLWKYFAIRIANHRTGGYVQTMFLLRVILALMDH